jgi:hypothetical protein
VPARTAAGSLSCVNDGIIQNLGTKLHIFCSISQNSCLHTDRIPGYVARQKTTDYPRPKNALLAFTPSGPNQVVGDLGGGDALCHCDKIMGRPDFLVGGFKHPYDILSYPRTIPSAAFFAHLPD